MTLKMTCECLSFLLRVNFLRDGPVFVIFATVSQNTKYPVAPHGIYCLQYLFNAVLIIACIGGQMDTYARIEQT